MSDGATGPTGARRRGGLSLAVIGLLVLGSAAEILPQEPAGQAPPAFTAGVDLVSVAVVVRDDRGRLVTGLSARDFEVYEAGQRRPIRQFGVEASGAVSLGLLFDVSGSMRLVSKLDAARRTARHLLARLDFDSLARDEAAVFAFDSALLEIEPFTRDSRSLFEALSQFQPFGATSLYDAVAAGAQRVADRATQRRALIVLTDGVDTQSDLTAPEVSGIASAIDVPVYLVAVVSPLDHDGASGQVQSASRPLVTATLRDLARWTGGMFHQVSAPEHMGKVTREIIEELRQQYVIAFESADAPGWYPLEIRIRGRDHFVQARSGYFSG